MYCYFKNIKELKNAILYAEEKLKRIDYTFEKEFYINNLKAYKKLMKKMKG
tara:strand:+ start:1084 stop:1236 length:153 start_codon:yes stop_codon:yes gene_type:complete